MRGGISDDGVTDTILNADGDDGVAVLVVGRDTNGMLDVEVDLVGQTLVKRMQDARIFATKGAHVCFVALVLETERVVVRVAVGVLGVVERQTLQ